MSLPPPMSSIPPGQSEQPHLDSVRILGVTVHTVSVEDVLHVIERAVEQRKHIYITYVNVYAMNLAYTIPWFRTVLNRSEVSFCDGYGVKWGARLLGYHIPHRFTPPDWIEQLTHLASERHYTLYLLGARPGVASKVAERLQEQFPTLHVVGSHHGYFDKEVGSEENEAVVRAINEAKPNILLVGFGMPLQEQWLMNNWERIDANVALTGGAVFDYVSGELWRGPRWMTDHGFEWLSRLLAEPRRLWRRYIIGNPLFLWRILKQRFGLGASPE